MEDVCYKLLNPDPCLERRSDTSPVEPPARSPRRVLLQVGISLAAVLLVMAAVVAATVTAMAASAANPVARAAASDAPVDQPFAEHHLVLQLSDRDSAKQAMVLSVAYNLLKEYGPDLIAIEVVAFGPGIDLLRAGSNNRLRVDSLIAQGVRFSVCMNTVETIERETGKSVALNPNARKVQAGVARILVLAEHGYTLVRP